MDFQFVKIQRLKLDSQGKTCSTLIRLVIRIICSLNLCQVNKLTWYLNLYIDEACRLIEKVYHLYLFNYVYFYFAFIVFKSNSTSTFYWQFQQFYKVDKSTFSFDTNIFNVKRKSNNKKIIIKIDVLWAYIMSTLLIQSNLTFIARIIYKKIICRGLIID